MNTAFLLLYIADIFALLWWAARRAEQWDKRWWGVASIAMKYIPASIYIEGMITPRHSNARE